MEGKTNIFLRRLRLSGTGIVESLDIIDVGRNLKQFDGLTWLTLTPIFYDRSTPLRTIQGFFCTTVYSVLYTVVLRGATGCTDGTERRNVACRQQLWDDSHLRAQPQVDHDGSVVRRVRPLDPRMVSVLVYLASLRGWERLILFESSVWASVL